VLRRGDDDSAPLILFAQLSGDFPHFLLGIHDRLGKNVDAIRRDSQANQNLSIVGFLSSVGDT
jgi:hypothetical protein